MQRRASSTSESANAQPLPTTDAFGSSNDDYSSEFNNMLSAQQSGQYSLSPSTSMNDHLSPETMLSDQSYNDYGLYNNTNFDDQYLNAQFGPVLTLDEDATFSFENPGMAVQLPQQPMQTSQTTSNPQVTSSMSQTGTIFPSIEAPIPQRLGTSQKSSPSHLSRSQGSPATVGSAASRQMISPVVRVESFEDEMTQGLSKATSKSQPARKSNTHLSPYLAASDDSDNEDGSSLNADQSRSVPEVQRLDDGSWVGQSGLTPQARNQIRDLQVPTLDELQTQRDLAEKKAEVEEWLDHSEVGSDTEDRRQLSVPRGRQGARRRAKSTNDLGYFDQELVPRAPAIPGPGVYLDVPSDFEEDEEFSGSEPESPPANVHILNTDSYFPSTDSVQSGPQPWTDVDSQSVSQEKRYQPPTSNAAMMRFKQRAKDVESASLAATLGSSRSRRRSESDMGSIRTAKGISREIPSERPGKDKHNRKGSFFENIKSNLPGRSNSNQRKRKGTVTGGQQNDSGSGTSTPKEPQTTPSGVKRIGSWGKPKSPKLDTSPATLNAPPGDGNTLTVHSPTTPWGLAKNAIRRSRSKSDIGRSRSKSDTGRSLGLGELMTQFGGPPIPTLVSPVNPPIGTPNFSRPFRNADADDDSGDEGALQGGIVMDLAVRSDPIIPNYAGFKMQIRQLNPRVPEYLLERLTQEQIKRYQRLLSGRNKHRSAVQAKGCSSAGFCFEMGGKSKQMEPKGGNKEADPPFVGFQIINPGASAEKLEKESEGALIAAQFPSGVPPPPVQRLPAEFECPLCFKVKKFYKPSDWTKHVHEDVQPFTCTFPTCNEPKSFKRKADWVRHENERHRQLENWTCDIGECIHICYRKDNFVQHLVREHKIPEPKVRTGRSGASKSPNTPVNAQGWEDPFNTSLSAATTGSEDIWSIVDRCKRDAIKQPMDECCRFCGNICNTWKKLTVHLAKHMEQISMPILPLIDQKQTNTGAFSGSMVVPQIQGGPGPVLSDSPQDMPTFLSDEPSSLDIGDLNISQPYPSMTPGIALNGVTAQLGHTYPPPQYMVQRLQQQPQQNNFTQPQAQNLNYQIQSYPPPFVHSRSASSSTHHSNTPIASTSPNSNFQFSNPSSFPQQYSGVGQQNMFSSPVESSGFNDDALSGAEAPYLMPESGGASNPQTPGGLNIQNSTMPGQFDQTFNFMPQGQAYGYGGNRQYSGA